MKSILTIVIGTVAALYLWSKLQAPGAMSAIPVASGTPLNTGIAITPGSLNTVAPGVDLAFAGGCITDQPPPGSNPVLSPVILSGISGRMPATFAQPKVSVLSSGGTTRLY